MASEENRYLKIEIPSLKENIFLVSGFHGVEMLSDLFEFELKLVSEQKDVAFDKIIGSNATIAITLANGKTKFINGIIASFSHPDENIETAEKRLYMFNAQLVPWLWLLTLSSNMRIFQNRTVPEIIEEIFQEKNIKEYRIALDNTYEKRTYCVQYKETDFNFISRLLEDEGIFYYFDHTEKGKHTLVLADKPDKHTPCPNQETAVYKNLGNDNDENDGITSLQKTQQLIPDKVTLSDYNFQMPDTRLKAEAFSNINVGPADREIYEYPGGYLKKAHGDQRVSIRLQEQEARFTTISGASTCRAFTSGYRFTLTDYDRDELNNKAFVLTSIEHQDSQPGISSNADSSASYSNQFTCIPFDTPYRPERKHQKPMIHGAQTAKVVGGEGHEIFTDPDGHCMVKVQFHWDRKGEWNENSSCWIRVSQAWAGGGWGALHIPRVGQEVIVNFLEGDPDQPIITGCVYNGANTPPYKKPEEKTISAIKSQSSPGGQGSNEIRFEDAKDKEELYIHAQKNLIIAAENDKAESTGNDSHQTVGRDKLEFVRRDRHTIIQQDHLSKINRDHHFQINGKQAIEIQGSQSFTVNGDVIEFFKKNHSEQVSENYYLKGSNLILEAMTGLSIKVGENHITIDSSGITIKGNIVKLNSTGGSALSGTLGKVVPAIAPLKAVTSGNAAEGMSPEEAAAHNAPSHIESEEDNEEKVWIEFQLSDDEGQPVVGERYRITLADGETIAQGTTDSDGMVKVSGVDPGECEVTFPDLDKDAWEKE